jgi:hypothetical protein
MVVALASARAAGATGERLPFGAKVESFNYSTASGHGGGGVVAAAATGPA